MGVPGLRVRTRQLGRPQANRPPLRQRRTDPPERLARLRAAGFETTSRRGVRGPTSLHQQQWEHGLDHLRTYVAAHGDADVPRRHVTGDGFALGMWVQSRRKELRSGKLTDPDRLNALSKLGSSPIRTAAAASLQPPNADLQHLEKAVATVDSRTDTKPV